MISILIHEINAPLSSPQFSLSSCRKTPACTRLISLLLFIFYILGCFYHGLNDKFIDFPDVTYSRLQLYRIVSTPFFGLDIFMLLLSLYLFIPSASRLEQSFGSISLLLLILSLSILISVSHDILCFLIFFQTGDIHWSIHGFLVVALCTVTIDCCMDSDAPRYFLCVKLSPTVYPFFLLFFIWLCATDNTIDAFLAIVVGYICGSSCNNCCCCCFLPVLILVKLVIYGLKNIESSFVEHHPHSLSSSTSTCWIPISQSTRYGNSNTDINRSSGARSPAQAAVDHVIDYRYVTTNTSNPQQQYYSSVLRHEDELAVAAHRRITTPAPLVSADVEQPSAPALSVDEFSHWSYQAYGSTVDDGNGSRADSNHINNSTYAVALPIAVVVNDNPTAHIVPFSSPTSIG